MCRITAKWVGGATTVPTTLPTTGQATLATIAPSAWTGMSIAIIVSVMTAVGAMIIGAVKSAGMSAWMNATSAIMATATGTANIKTGLQKDSSRRSTCAAT